MVLIVTLTAAVGDIAAVTLAVRPQIRRERQPPVRRGAFW